MATVAPAESAARKSEAVHPNDAGSTCDALPNFFSWAGALHRCLGLFLLALFLPVIGLLVLLVRLTSHGPGIYRQTRVGRRGRDFTLYKIRTMCIDAEKKTGPVWTSVKDPRITLLGRILRATHLDELPQLFNVVRGEMSLVGPRPERPEFTQYLAKQIPGYLSRLRVAPGITGLAQINLPPDSDLESVRHKLTLDLEYIDRGSLWIDARILLCTALRLLGIRGLRFARLLGLRRKVKETAPREVLEKNGEFARLSVNGNGSVHGNGLGAVAQVFDSIEANRVPDPIGSEQQISPGHKMESLVASSNRRAHRVRSA